MSHLLRQAENLHYMSKELPGLAESLKGELEIPRGTTRKKIHATLSAAIEAADVAVPLKTFNALVEAMAS